jgi:hypothetical protein
MNLRSLLKSSTNCSVIVALAALTRWAGLLMLVMAITTLGCSYAGAGLAALTARRRSP